MNQEKNEERMDLDRMLAEMAQETPEMPADFHARWTEAVRAEAGQDNTEKKQDSRRQWRYILSAAAVFVFLIGGTLLTRGMDQKDGRKNAAVTVNTAVPSAVPEAVAAAAGTSFREAETDTAGEADLFMAMNEAAEKSEADAAWADASEQLSGMLSANGVKANEAAAKARPAAEPETAGESDEEEAIAEDAGFFMEEAAPEIAAAPETTGEPETTTEPEATAEPEAALPEETAETAQESGFVSFLKDLGIFTLKTLAVAVIAAALAFLTAGIIRKVRKKKT